MSDAARRAAHASGGIRSPTKEQRAGNRTRGGSRSPWRLPADSAGASAAATTKGSNTSKQQGLPLVYEGLLDEPTHDPELVEIRRLRAKTRHLVLQLWDASRDNESFESLVQPIEQYPEDLVREEREGRWTATAPAPAAHAHAHRPGSNVTGLWTHRQQPLVPRAMQRPLSRHSRAQDDRPRTAQSVRSQPRTSRGTTPARGTARRALSPERTRVAPISREHREALVQQQRERDAWHILSREDAFFADLQQFRRLYPDLFSPEIPHRTSIYREPDDEPAQPPVPQEQDYFYNGLFKINDRLFPEHVDHPFKSSEDYDVFLLDEKSRNLAEDEPPVKVSIPISRIEPTRKEYKPHRRSSFDPGDSADIGAFLHKGYRPYLWSSRVLRVGSEHISLKEEVQHANRVASK
ncbi:hypothetical protein HK105_202363 [Polyrhizophydium stewartii]|uniref:Uncharacterized protein n=1 Tax=Polyrhizophydium stewartii TaxID=2732419 RepID=A0ABR4NEJ5_9FUNG